MHYHEKLKLNGKIERIKLIFILVFLYYYRRKRLYLSLDLPTLLEERNIDTNKLMPKYVPADKPVTLNIPNEVKH
jgi:hypothetical protein